MTLRRQLQATASVVTLLMMLALVGLHRAQAEQERAAELRHATEALAVEVLALLAHTQEYAQHDHDRVVRQWRRRFDNAAALIDGMAEHEVQLPPGTSVTALPGRWQTLGELFEHLTQLDADGASMTPALRERTRAFLVDRLASQAQSIAEQVLALGRATDGVRHRVDARVQHTTVGVAVLFALSFLALAWLVQARILGPLQTLQQAVLQLVAGDISLPLQNQARDEMGTLSRSFDEMRRSLRRRETELADSERFLRELVDALPNALVHVDTGGRITTVNPAAEQLFGFTRQQLVGQPVEMLVPPELAERHREQRAERSRNANATSAMREPRTMRGLRADGEVFDVRIALAEMGTGAHAGTLALVVDINELIERGRELERSNAELARFAYVASHDLQEPLRVVTSCNEMLKETAADRLDADSIELMDFSIAAARRMQNLIRDLLAYSRIESRGAELVDVDTGDLCAQVLANLRVSIEEADARVEVATLPRVRGDQRQLAQLMQNLIGNAIKYRGDEAPVVHIDAEPQGSFWVFSVRDNGIGIDPRFHDRVFEIFKRLHEQGRFEGTGIGLAICARVVQRHGGRIWVQSEPGRGATFKFTLPAADAVAPAADTTLARVANG